MASIPVTFTFRDKEYKGYLSEIAPPGSPVSHWHLIVDNYYWGQLGYNPDQGFSYYNQHNTKEMVYLGEVFGEAVMLWYE